jgi:hypothetical protein
MEDGRRPVISIPMFHEDLCAPETLKQAGIPWSTARGAGAECETAFSQVGI